MIKYLLFVFFVVVTPCFGEVRLPKILASQMVLQRNSDVKIWGWADVGEEVEVHGDWSNKLASTKTDVNGRWEVELRTGDAGGPHSITILGQNEIVLRDILFGEVWLASGQSNMEMPPKKVSNAYTGIKDSESEIQDAAYPNIRLFQVGNFSSKEPLDDVQSGITMYGIPPAECRWQACTPETVSTFSSTAYFFARALNSELKVPIGIIDSSWGGTSAETWTPEPGLRHLGYEADLKQATDSPQKSDQKIPTRLYNGMIHPLRNVNIRGVIWYQGEGNASRADKYKELFSTMIRQWRGVWEDDFSFYFVQISPFNYGKTNSAYLREAQFQTTLPATGMVVTLDIGDLKDIHPKNKQEVGRRLALLALTNDYGKEVIASGPIFREIVLEDGQIRVRFDHVGNGLGTRDGRPPSHFEIASDDQVFHPAVATIVGNEIVVSSEKVKSPVAVRFAFSNDAIPNLINREGLPASSFRTDRW